MLAGGENQNKVLLSCNRRTTGRETVPSEWDSSLLEAEQGGGGGLRSSRATWSEVPTL